MRTPVSPVLLGPLASFLRRLPRGVNFLLAVLCMAWVVNPLDFDWVPVIGWIDDAAAAWFAWMNVQEVFWKSSAVGTSANDVTIPGTAKRID